MFRGHFEHAIDAKGRTSLPSRFRDVLVTGGDLRAVLAPSPLDPCLEFYPLKAWEEFEAKIATLPQFEPTVIRLRRVYVSAAVECEIDKQGRVLIPNSLREHAGLTKDVFFAGMGRTVELWAKEKWAETHTLMSEAEKVDFRQELARLQI